MEYLKLYLPPVIVSTVVEYAKTGILLFKKNEFYFYDGVKWYNFAYGYLNSSHTSTPLFKQANYFNAINELLKNNGVSWYDKKFICEFPSPKKKCGEITDPQPGVIGSTVFFTGGMKDSQETNRVCSVFEGRWAFNIAPLNKARGGHITITLNNRLYVIGGLYASCRSVEYYENGKWTEVASTYYPRCNKNSCATVCNRKIYVLGDFRVNDTDNLYMEEYDPSSNVWNVVTYLPSQRDKFTVFTFEQCIYVVGGRSIKDNGGFRNCESVECYDPINHVWSVVNMKWFANGYCNAIEL